MVDVRCSTACSHSVCAQSSFRSLSRQTAPPAHPAMYQFQHGNPGFVPQQGQPNAPHARANNQQRRPLAIDELLNEVPPRRFQRDERSGTVSLAIDNQLLTITSSQLQPRYPDISQSPPSIQTPNSQPRDTYNPYPPTTMYRNLPYMEAGHRMELPPPPPNEVMGRWREAGQHDWYMSHPRGTGPVPHHQCKSIFLLIFLPNLKIETFQSLPVRVQFMHI